MSPEIAPRRVSFDWSRTPLHWIPGEPTATHVINVLHLLLPAGERWFVKVLKEGLPLVSDPELRADVKGFMGQEATHSVQHTHVLDHLAAQRLDAAGFTKYVDFLFERLLGERPPSTRPFPRASGCASGCRSSPPSNSSRPCSATGYWPPTDSTGPAPTRSCSTCCAGTAPRKSNTARSPSTCTSTAAAPERPDTPAGSRAWRSPPR